MSVQNFFSEPSAPAFTYGPTIDNVNLVTVATDQTIDGAKIFTTPPYGNTTDFNMLPALTLEAMLLKYATPSAYKIQDADVITGSVTNTPFVVVEIPADTLVQGWWSVQFTLTVSGTFVDGTPVAYSWRLWNSGGTLRESTYNSIFYTGGNDITLTLLVNVTDSTQPQNIEFNLLEDGFAEPYDLTITDVYANRV